MVLAWAPAANTPALRRLKLAAINSHCVGILFRPMDIQDALPNETAIGARHSRFFLLLTARDHQTSRDLQLSQYIAVLITFDAPGLHFVVSSHHQLNRRVDPSTISGSGAGSMQSRPSQSVPTGTSPVAAPR